MIAIKNYLLSVTAAAFTFSVLSNLLPKGKYKQYLHFVGTLVMILVVLSPIMKLDASQISKAIAFHRIQTEEWRTGVEIHSRDLQGRIIKEQSEAYVLDKAEALGVSISLEITLQEDGTYPYPYEIWLEGKWTEDEKCVLSTIISEDLGIPAHRQEWRGT